MYTASYAKINLFLEITGKLANNYHQVNTVLCSIDLCDFISYSLLDYPEISLSCSNPALSGKYNLIFRVAEHLQQRYCPSQGILIHLEKHIPIAAGLGGGSSNAANCIIALNTLWQLNLPPQDLHDIAASFGSDINFFLLGGTALGTNRGEQVSQLPDIKLEHILLVNPQIEIPSSFAYKIMKLPDLSAQKQFDMDKLSSTCFNRLEAGIRQTYHAIDELICTISSFGADVSMLSGSGSTCYGLFTNNNDLLACQQYCSEKGYWTYITKTLSNS